METKWYHSLLPSWALPSFENNLPTEVINLAKEELLVDEKRINKIVLPNGRVSYPDHDNTSVIAYLEKDLKRLEADWFEIIPIVRKMCRVNSDMSQALNDIVQLANTGIKINFDPSVDSKIMDQMREEIQNASKGWGTGLAGIHGISNKFFSQLMIGGATSAEWVPNKTLTGIQSLFFLNPEKIRVLTDVTNGKYTWHQLIKHTLLRDTKDLIKLNPNTFKYYALNGDEDIPYGIPPYWSALDPLNTQLQMIDNIKFVSSMLGILGFADVTMTKPDQEDGESEVVYRARLETLLDALKARVKQNYKDGINVGYKDDHEFNFNSASKDVSGAQNLFNINEQLVSSGLKFDSAFLGRNYGGGSEGMITILFTKMLSQLNNMQLIVAESLKEGFTLHLRLKGFKFKYLDVEFNKSTITDELKYQQAQEYKIKNLASLYADGIISQDQYADAMGYKGANLPEPRLPLEQRSGNSPSIDDQNRAAQKDASDRKQRDKSKPQGSKKVPTKTRP